MSGSDEQPPGAGVDPLLSLSGRTPGPGGLWSKLGLAVLAVLLLALLIGGAIVVAHLSPRSSPSADQAVGSATLPVGGPRR
ncbi:hypothetical protein [Phenylobacterium soli]